MTTAKMLTLPSGTFKIEGAGHYFEHIPEGLYNDPNIDLIRRLLPQSGTLYDIGANIGLVSIGVADIAEKIVAVEPSTSTFERLKKNALGSNIVLICGLVGNSGEERIFLDNAADPTGSTSLVPGMQAFAGHDYLKATTLTAVSLNSLIDTHGAPSFIKIDVEGAELDVLKSGWRSIEQHKPICLIEFNALALMNFGASNPPAALRKLKASFPYVYRVDGTELKEVVDEYAFIVEHVLHRGCVDDLLCSFSPMNNL